MNNTLRNWTIFISCILVGLFFLIATNCFDEKFDKKFDNSTKKMDMGPV